MSSIDKNVGTMESDNNEYDELKDALGTAVTGFMAFVDKFKATATMAYNYKEAYRASRGVFKRKRESVASELEREKKRSKELLDANKMLVRDIGVERLEGIDYKEQRDMAEQDLDVVKTELAKARSRAHKQRQYVKALKETLADKDASIARLETELNQVRQRLHQFTRITCPRGQRPGCSTWVDAENESTEEED